ncbi:hypothetical protein V8C42DRAFT_326246 [Trichoderma barbatum]
MKCLRTPPPSSLHSAACSPGFQIRQTCPKQQKPQSAISPRELSVPVQPCRPHGSQCSETAPPLTCLSVLSVVGISFTTNTLVLGKSYVGSLRRAASHKAANFLYASRLTVYVEQIENKERTPLRSDFSHCRDRVVLLSACPSPQKRTIRKSTVSISTLLMPTAPCKQVSISIRAFGTCSCTPKTIKIDQVSISPRLRQVVT